MVKLIDSWFKAFCGAITLGSSKKSPKPIPSTNSRKYKVDLENGPKFFGPTSSAKALAWFT
tara:strand:- start:235 stop:417 length:183 start_codon:yes stop_codon:yes gene_type:complete